MCQQVTLWSLVEAAERPGLMGAEELVRDQPRGGMLERRQAAPNIKPMNWG